MVRGQISHVITRQTSPRSISAGLNDKKLMQEEYKIRNEKLPLEKKIFSVRVLSDIMIREREKYFSNFLHKKPQILCQPQDISFRPLYSYKYSIFLWVTCSYRKECSLKTMNCLCCNNIYHPCSGWRCFHSLYNTFSAFFKTFPTHTKNAPA